ncbi:glycosyltransferase family 34 protein [Cucurbitaria berberidis CBS 394.84]|uniref:Glycosyltransferase family 34 protein n=1 Tax=Cucurbitaria berberidis CBS 394.84 TaxID=1168544 RepID=A0A9P4L5W7_9PLEO|nr:glycosyltransferase family 34 protein [Cucurbitaria berberidis CBS 394.84]KAF1842752.1 glycosyltransferase family 34 protein [Cucurbitaria berberidis CBS 394.84]
MPLPGSLLPKVLIAVFTIAVFYQLPLFSTAPHIADPSPTKLSNIPEGSWFRDAIKTHQAEDNDEESSALANSISGTTSDLVTKTSISADASAAPSSSNTTTASILSEYNRTFISYGTTQCLPHFDDHMKQSAIARNESCTKHTPFTPEETRRVAFASITTGQPAEAYQRAIQSQMFHSAVHGTSTHILCEQLSDGAWNKIAFLLNLVMNEMLKPEDERLEWVMWIDRDAIVLDSCRPLSAFVPPATKDYETVNLIINNDGLGLNAGVFMFRVNEWSISLFNTILAYRYFRPDEELVLAEQTAMEKIINEEKWKDGVARVPWYWFNAYPDENESVEKYRDGLEPEDLEWFRARKGDFIVHFAGDDGRSGRMPEWLNMLGEVGNVWEKGETKRDITVEIQKYWRSWESGTLTDAQISGEPQNDGHVNQREEEG